MESRNWPRHVADPGQKRAAYEILVGEPEGEAPAVHERAILKLGLREAAHQLCQDMRQKRQKLTSAS
jgi:hypothetical protein